MLLYFISFWCLIMGRLNIPGILHIQGTGARVVGLLIGCYTYYYSSDFFYYVMSSVAMEQMANSSQLVTRLMFEGFQLFAFITVSYFVFKDKKSAQQVRNSAVQGFHIYSKI